MNQKIHGWEKTYIPWPQEQCKLESRVFASYENISSFLGKSSYDRCYFIRKKWRNMLGLGCLTLVRLSYYNMS